MPFLIASLLMMLLLGASPVSAQTATLNVVLGDQVTLTDRGVFGTVPVSLTCDFPGNVEFGNINIEVQQFQGNKIVRGGGSLAAGFGHEECDGIAHTFDVRINAFFSPFRPGSGLVRADAFVCGTDPEGQSICLNATTEWQTLDFKPAPRF